MANTMNDLAPDTFGYREDYLDALGRVGPDGTALAAWRLALAWGRCLLYGVPVGDAGGPLAPRIATLAIDELEARSAAMTREADRLEADWGEAVDPSEGDDYCARLLNFRMDLWAVALAVDEAALAAGGAALRAALDRSDEAADRFDRALEARVKILATVSGTRLLENWRDMLAAPYRDPLPWWLDGTLEAVARRTEEEAVRTMPGPGAWAALTRLPSPSWTRVGEILGQLIRPATPAFGYGETEGRGPRSGPVLCWLSPDGRWRAEVCVPDPLTPEEVARPRPMAFTRVADDAAAVELAGAVIRLDGVTAEVGADGRADVRLEDLGRSASFVVAWAGGSDSWAFEEESR